MHIAGHGRLFLRQSSTFDPSQIPTECQDVCNSVVDHANVCIFLDDVPTIQFG
jgi:hypothetical protein